jgi:thiamine biosynthesis lipoprotein
MSRFEFHAIGTSWVIDTAMPLGDGSRRRILDLAEDFDAVHSRFREDSLINRIAQAEDGGTFEFPTASAGIFDLYDRLHLATDGAVDPLVGRDLELLGYDRQYSLTPSLSGMAAHHLRRPVWNGDVVRSGRTIITEKPMTIDLGAVGKGHLVDLMSAVLVTDGFDEFMIDGSGDMSHRGHEVFEVGLEHPLDPTAVIGIARLGNASLCASAVNRRRWGNGLHHVLDCRTGIPVHDVIATWVIAQNTATADGLATALFFMPAARLASISDFSFVRMFSDGSAEVSDNFDGEVFS